jgi:di/tricarboxylate transporter
VGKAGISPKKAILTHDNLNRTQDYLRIGGGLALIYMAVLVGMTYFFYL